MPLVSPVISDNSNQTQWKNDQLFCIPLGGIILNSQYGSQLLSNIGNVRQSIKADDK